MVDMETLLQHALSIYFVVYLVTAFLLPSYRVWKRTGINPYRFGKTDNTHDFTGRLFRLTFASGAVVISVHSFWRDGYHYLTPINWLQEPALVLMGLILLMASLFWILAAQAQMGNAWRIGIDTDTQIDFVQRGLFRLSRNPVFLGMRFTLLGFFLVLPNMITLVILILGDVLLQIQVRLEEEHLAHVHGESYQRYCRQTRRWL